MSVTFWTSRQNSFLLCFEQFTKKPSSHRNYKGGTKIIHSTQSVTPTNKNDSRKLEALLCFQK